MLGLAFRQPVGRAFCPSFSRPKRAPRAGPFTFQCTTKLLIGQTQFITQSAENPTNPGTGGDVKYFTIEEVGQHSSEDDAWMVLGGVVYDITDYLKAHPGGSSILLRFAGQDATKQFNAVHPWVSHQRILQNRIVGFLRQ
eukprot:Protomagalhaensia_wolfi_Nauph_80__2892@NODE_2983_length_926_cov_175_278467_g2340_i0_p1_GENE_NODE_2983_length_926_cov_175_278467_g2340_i0NODE_2983_length_926_cov_175_278467_g2340_i0_p1_ORF_typecomplete_len140_score6_15Cytb5/PF00173_28/4_4e23OMP_bbrl/PF13505_6/0_089_NODE_2983_length_926_cov_175_278467_g2340_i0428847